ncbi:MAG TPA: terminase family protein [Mesotoga sp.]|nr:terminase family protein [Mesotoga sp.]
MKKVSESEKNKFAQAILNIDYELDPMCANCVFRHVSEKGLDFDVRCRPIPKGGIRELYGIDEGDDVAMMLFDPVYFAFDLGFELRRFQREILTCTSKRKTLRISRQCGKTIAMGISALHYAFTNERKRVLIATPQDNQVKNIFDKMNSMIQSSELLRASITSKSSIKGRFYSSDPYEISFSNGSVISGFTTGFSSGKGIRGQSADFIVIDEMDYMGVPDVEAVIAILSGNPDADLIASSTPSGDHSFFYMWCNSPQFKELHAQYQSMEHYSERQDAEFKAMYTKEGYEREILALFTAQENGVFPNHFIDRAVKDYSYNVDNLPQGIYTLGVDWNESFAGVHLALVRYDTELNRFVTYTDIVEPSRFTQPEAVRRIIELHKKYHFQKIVVDKGFGQMQVQSLYSIADSNPSLITEDQIVPVGFSDTIELLHPINGQKFEQMMKVFIVQTTSRYFERNLITLSSSDDIGNRLVKQLRSYKVEGTTDRGPRYSKGYVHTLEAFILALYGMYLINAESNRTLTHAVAVEAKREEEAGRFVVPGRAGLSDRSWATMNRRTRRGFAPRR